MRHFLRLGRIFQVEDNDDVPDVPFLGGGNIGVAAIEIVAVHAGTIRLHFAIIFGSAGFLTS